MFFKNLSKINFFVSSIFLTISIIAILIEIFTRYFLHFSFAGNEELARLMTIYAMMIGGALALDLDEHPNIDIFRYMVIKKGGRLDLFINILSYLLLIPFFIYFLIQGYSILINEGKLLTPCLRIYWYYGYFAIILGSVLMGLYSIKKLFISIKDFVYLSKK